MSGFEIAGAVLGAVPLLISALEHYAEGIATIQSIIGYKALLDRLVLDYGTVLVNFEDTWRKLLSRLELSQEDIDKLLDKPKQEDWNDEELKHSVEDLLGKRRFELYMGHVGQVFSIIDDFGKKLDLNSQYRPKWLKNGAESLPKATRRERLMKYLRKSSGAWKAVMLGFDRNEYATMINRIQYDIDMIDKLVGGIIEVPGWRATTSRAINPKFLSTIRDYASSLFNSITWHCPCEPSHTAHLQLRTRRPRADYKTRYGFKVAFAVSPASSTVSTSRCWQEAEVVPSEDMVGRNVAFQIPGPSDLVGPEIASLCTALKHAPQVDGCIGFLKHHGYRHHIITNCNTVQRTIYSLHDVLISNDSSAESTLYLGGCKLDDIRERYDLSRKLASTVLYLQSTPWLNQTWCKDDIYFIRNEADAMAEHLYISKSTPDLHSSHVSQHPAAIPSIYELGIVLLEIALGYPLEKVPHLASDLDAQGQPHAGTELNKASRLLKQVERHEGAPFADIIKRCLWGRFGTTSRSLQDQQLVELFYKNVVVPLEECYEFMTERDNI